MSTMNYGASLVPDEELEAAVEYFLADCRGCDGAEQVIAALTRVLARRQRSRPAGLGGGSEAGRSHASGEGPNRVLELQAQSSARS